MNPRQQPWPRTWLMTDERMGDRLWDAIERLPTNASGIVVRHYSLDRERRHALAGMVAQVASRRGITFAIAADVALARELGAALVHNPGEAPRDLPFSRSVHSIAEAETAKHEGAALVFVSPVQATRSHPGRPPLGPELACAIAKAAGATAIALGGMDAQSFARLSKAGFHGWAAIDAWM